MLASSRTRANGLRAATPRHSAPRAAGDLNGDGRADVITGAGVGGNGHVKAFDGASGALLDSFLTWFSGGVAVAVDHRDGNGPDEILVASGGGDIPLVEIFDPRAQFIDQFFYAFDQSFLGGVDTGNAGGDEPPPPPPPPPPPVINFDFSHLLDLSLVGITL
jgi:hypothetical protein